MILSHVHQLHNAIHDQLTNKLALKNVKFGPRDPWKVIKTDKHW